MILVEFQVICIVLLVLGGIAWPFIRAPIRTRLTNWQSADSRFEPWQGDRLPRDQADMIDELTELGFDVRGHWRHIGHSTATAKITLLENPQTLDVAKILVHTAGTRRHLTLAFQTRFDDGTELATANNQVTAGLPSLPGITVLWLPEVRDALQLLRVHSQVRHRLGVDKRRRSVGQDPVAFLLEGQQRMFDHQVKTGYYYLDEARGVYRPTWKGAFLITWRLLWPIRPLFRAWRRRPTHRLLRELGVPLNQD
jgi:hypothetical protein